MISGSAVVQFSVMISRLAMTQFLLIIPCVSHDFVFAVIPYVRHELVFAVNFIRQLSLNFQWWFLGLKWLYFRSRFHASAVTLFSLKIPNASRELVVVVDSIRQSSLSFCWRFLGQQWHSVSDNFMRQPWISFHWWFHELVFVVDSMR